MATSERPPTRGRRTGAAPPSRRASSRLIDRVADALGHERAFVAAAVLVLLASVVGLATNRVTDVATAVSLLTFVMVFAVQHTSSRESRALNLKLDELIRVTEARNELIGAEDESHAKLDERRRDLRGERGVNLAG
jgi:low affinity Fe/Cu permease